MAISSVAVLLLTVGVQQRYEVQMDTFHKEKRLDLYRSDGSPKNPMFLAYSTPQMLPTTTLHATAAATGNSRVKRSASHNKINPRSESVFRKKDEYVSRSLLWWFGLISISIGSVMIFFS